jgi:hypothetical protein
MVGCGAKLGLQEGQEKLRHAGVAHGMAVVEATER